MNWEAVIWLLFVFVGIVTTLYEINKVISIAVGYRRTTGADEYVAILREDLYSALTHFVAIIVAGAVGIDAIFFTTHLDLPGYEPTLADQFIGWGLIAFLALPEINSLIKIRQQGRREKQIIQEMQAVRERQRARRELLKEGSLTDAS